MTITATPGTAVTLTLSFFNETAGVLTDAASVVLDITYGTEVGLSPDVAGPFSYLGASAPTPGQVYRTGVGQYAFVWQVPVGSPSGVYVANWSCGFGADTFLGIENFVVIGGTVPGAPPMVDTGFWTGAITYGTNTIEFGQVDGDGIAWLWQQLVGWDGVDVSGGVTQKSGDHGGWPGPQFYAPRVMTWTVMASAPTQGLRDLARSKLQAAVPVSDLATFRYDEPIPKTAQVRRSGKISETYPTLTDVAFSVLLVAPDPRKYSAQQHTATVAATGASSSIGITPPFTLPFTFPAQPPYGSVVCPNEGDFGSPPVITITGPITSPGLVNVTTGQQVSWTGLIIPAGSVLVADFSTRLAQLNGVYRPADARSAWWELEPGDNTVQITGQNDSGATMSVSWRDSWQ